MAPVIAEYIEMGLNFAVFKFSFEEGDYNYDVPVHTQSVVMTYEADTRVLPIRLNVPVAAEDVTVRVWILGDMQHVPGNYAHPRIDYGTFRGQRQLRRFYGHSVTHSVTYGETLARFRDEYNGLAFVTDYAQPTSSLSFEVENELLEDLVLRFPYITRLQARISPEQMTLDPVFVAAPAAPDVSNVVDLGEYVDPLEYWGCSTRAIQDPEAEALIAGFVQPGQFYPAGWALALDEEGMWMQVYSPEPVTWDTVYDFLTGGKTPPMSMQFRANDYYIEEDAWDTLLRGAGMESDAISPDDLGEEQCVMRWTYILYPKYTDVTVQYRYWEEGVHHILLTSREDCEENGDRYTAMIDYWGTYPYYAHPELRHTLFLGNKLLRGPLLPETEYIPALYFGFPDGW